MPQAQNPRNPETESIEKNVYGDPEGGNGRQQRSSGFSTINRLIGGKKAKMKVGQFVANIISKIGLKFILIGVSILACLLILVGIIAFLLTGPNAVFAHLVEMADNLWTSVKGVAVGQAQAQIKDEDVVNIGKYLNNMGYSIEGYGFGTATRDKNGKITDIKGKYIPAYLAAENKTYMIANTNFNFRDLFNHFFDDGNLSTWGSGMIVLNNSLWSPNNPGRDNVKVDRKNKLLEVQIKDDTYQYNLDGWMGRYGKPIEFLLALHTGTMAPDFAYEVAVGKDFDTKVFVKFKKVGVTTRLKFTSPQTGNTHYVTKSKNDPDGWTYWEDIIKEATSYYSRFLASGQTKVDAYQQVKDRFGIDLDDVNNAIAYEKEHTKFTYTPYIRAVGNHWFRDLDFKDAYVQVKATTTEKGKYNVFDVEEVKDGDIVQVREPKIVGNGIKVGADDQNNVPSAKTTVEEKKTSSNASIGAKISASDTTPTWQDTGVFGTGTTTSGNDKSSSTGTNSQTNNKSSGNATTTNGGNSYEGKRMDDLLKQQFQIADGINGVSTEKYNVTWKNMRYAITMLETVHSEDAQCIVRDLKRYLNKRGFAKFTDQYVITDPSKVKSYNDDRNLEYGGEEYDFDYSRKDGSGLTVKQAPLGNILDNQTGGVEVSEDRMSVILHHKSENNQDGFDTGATVKSPGSGTVIARNDGTVKIKLTTSGAEGKTITITGFQVDSSIQTGTKVSKGQKIGVTGDGDIVVTMEDENGKAISPVGYLPVVSASSSDVDELARVMQAEDGTSDEGMVAVGYVVLHRVSAPGRFKDSIHEVINEPGQFQPVDNGSINDSASTKALNLARAVLTGSIQDPVAATGKLDGDSLYFLSTWTYHVPQEYLDSHPVAIVGNHYYSHDGEYHEEMQNY